MHCDDLNVQKVTKMAKMTKKNKVKSFTGQLPCSGNVKIVFSNGLMKVRVWTVIICTMFKVDSIV